MVVEEITGKCCDEYSEHEDNEEAIYALGTEAETHHRLQIPEPQKGEELQVILDQKFD